MATMKMFTIKDRAADAFGAPVFFPSTGVAIRSFTDEVNRSEGNNNLYLHPDDFDMYEIGDFDTDTAMFTSAGMTVVCRAKDVSLKFENPPNVTQLRKGEN